MTFKTMSKNNNKKIQEILRELYKRNPELKKREKDLKKVVASLLELKPEVEPDQDFLLELKNKLLREFPEKRSGFFWSLKWAWVPLGAAALVLVISSIYMVEFSPSYKIAREEGEDGLGMEVEKLEKRAFGDLSWRVEQPRDFGVDGGGQLHTETEGRGSAEEEDDVESAEENRVSDPESRVVPNRINYEFVYTGEERDPEGRELPVFKRVKDDSLSRKLAGQFGDLDLGLMDWSRLRDKEIKNLNLVEDREFGFSIDFNLDNNEVSLSKNWSEWPDPFRECGGDSECLEEKKLNLDDIPPEEELVAIADDFLQDFGVDTSYYGRGRVQEYWRKSLELSRDQENFRVPDSISVVYPLKIDNKTVYGRGGDPDGLRVNVDIRHQRVSGLRRLYIAKFRSSSYPALSDFETIVSRAEKGGLDRPYTHSDPTQTVQVKLGAPSLDLVKVYNRKENSKQAEELYVPAYVFPVTEVSEKTHFLKERIVIPAVEGVWQEEARSDIGIPEER